MAPQLPQSGVITAFSHDGVGRLRLDDGTELKLGRVALEGVINFAAEERPVVGIRVTVLEVAPHPLGGLRVKKLQRGRPAVTFGRPSSRRQWEKQLRAIGLSAVRTNRVVNALRPAAALIVKTGRASKLGASKLGGWPDVPAGFRWPRVKTGSLVFAAQLRLDDVPASVASDLQLPQRGLIALFLGPPPYCELLHVADPVARFESAGAPAIHEHPLGLEEIWTPLRDALFGEDAETATTYAAVLADFDRAASLRLHQLGGHPTPVHDSMEGDHERLVLQLDHDDSVTWVEDSPMTWGDAGRAFVLATPGSLATARFTIQD